DGPLTNYAGIGKVHNPLPLLLAVPTTVGTGSEVTIFAVITDRSRHLKMSIGSRLLVPKVAVLDPELTMSLPDSLVASTGIDALTHAIEAYTSLQANPFSDTLALGAIRLIAAHIQAAVGDRSPEAMASMLYASCMAGMALSHARVTLVHGMSHPLGGYYDIPHGLANAILLPYVLEFNKGACPERLATIAEALGEDIRSLTPQAAAEKAVETVRRICADVGIPLHLKEVGVTEEYIPQMAADAVESGPTKANPRKPTLEDVIALYRKAL
ncbi:MAG: iron-containing alcohol dehydrogenase, partial [Anaerolineae bacterium]